MAITVDSSVFSGSLTSPPTTVSITTHGSNELLVVIADVDIAGTPSPSVSSSPSLSWTTKYNVNVGNGCLSNWVFVAYAVAASAGTYSITVNVPGAAYVDVAVVTLAGANNSSPFDPNSTLPAYGGTTAISFSVTISTTNANAIVLMAGGTCHGNISNFSTSFGSTTLIGNGGYSGFAYIIASGTLSGATVTENLGSSDGVGLFVFAIDPAGAPPPPPPPPPHSLAPGTLYYVPVTLTNNQSTPTPANYTAKIAVNQSNYSSYLASDLSNVNWQDGNGNILNSWREAGTSNTGTDALYWVNLGSLTVPANGSLTIYLCFYATTQNVLNTTNTGVAPQLTSTYGQYDNGINVFQFYDNFAGTSLSSKWSSFGYGAPTLTVNNGLTISQTGTNWGGVIAAYSPPSTGVVIESLTKYTTIQRFTQAITQSNGAGNYNGPSPGYGSGWTDTGSATVNRIIRFDSTTETVLASSSNSVNSNTFYLLGLSWASGGTLNLYNNYSVWVTATDTTYTSFSYLSLTVWNPGVYFVQWVRARLYPPNGTDPSVSFGSIATAASFSLSVQFSPAYVAQGEQLTEDIIATLVAGSPGQVSYSISGLPPKATASFSPPSCTPTCLTLLTVNIDPSTPLGTYNTTITGTSSSTGATATVQLVIVVVASTAKVAEVNCAPYIPPSLSEVQQQKLIIPATRPLRLPPEKFTKLPPAIDPAIPCYVASPIEIGIDLYVYGSGPLQGVTVRMVKENSPFIVKNTDSNGHVSFEAADFISPRSGLPVDFFHLDILPQDGIHACAWVNANIKGPSKLEVTLVTNPPPNIALPLQFRNDTPNTLYVFNSGESLCPSSAALTGGRLDFIPASDPTYVFVADLKQVPGLRFVGGGILLKSSGVYQQVQPFQAPPAFPGSGAEFPSGLALLYYTGIIAYIGNTTSQYLCQIDSRGFVLFRSVLGTVTVPLLDGMNYSTNGTISGNTVNLAAGQTVLFYPPAMLSPPVLGNYFTADIEQAVGAQVQLTLTTGTTVSFYVQAGKSSTVFYVYNPGFSSSNNWINDTPLTYARYRNNGHVNQPGYPIFCIHWSWRQYDADGTSLASDPFSDLFMYPTPVYMDDPNVVTWKGGNFLPIMIKAIQQSALPSGFDFGFAYQIAHYDSSKTLRYYRRAAVVFGDQSPVWKVKVYSYVNAQTNVYNYDEGGNTTGYSHASYLTRGESGNLNSGYMVYNGSWISGTWSSSGYTWLDGYWAARVTLPPVSPAVATLYIYSKYNVAGSTEAPVPADGTYRISHYPTFTYILQYFNVWADVTIPAGWSGGLETEFWYAETDTYEASPPKPTFTSNTAWIDGFF